MSLSIDGLHVFERGWLSSNNILVIGEHDASLFDSGYVSHAAQTVELVRSRLAGRPLARVVNTHLHSDHCGGNAALQRAFGCDAWIPPGHWQAVQDWDDAALTFAATGQSCERFVAQRALVPGETLALGGREWLVLQAPGHDPHSMIFFEPAERLLISADALWENGFGVVFPEIEGEPGFDDVGAALDLIESLQPRLVIPGHGQPFSDAAAAIGRARQRLRQHVADPRGHAWHAAKVLVKFHLLAQRSVDAEQLGSWAAGVPFMRLLHARHFGDEPAAEWSRRIVDSLCRSGAARREGARVIDA